MIFIITLEFKEITKEDTKGRKFITLDEPIYIPYRFITLNKYRYMNRQYKAIITKQEIAAAYSYLVYNDKIQTPCKIKFTWYVKSKREDLDNICFAKKFILDAMQKAGLIENDNLNHIQGFQDEFIISKNKEGVYIEII